MISRRKALYALAGIPAAGAYAVGIEPRWLDTEMNKVSMPGLGRRMRVVQLTDLHASDFVPLGMIADAVTAAIAAKPDLICLTGDYISYQDIPSADAYARTLAPLAKAAPTYAVLGNHDGGPWAENDGGFSHHRYAEKVLEMAGIELLHNRSKVVEVHGHPLALVGMGDSWSREFEPVAAFAGIRKHQVPTVVLSHNPDTKDNLSEYPWRLMLSGHTHGGQVIVPLYGPPIIPVRDRRYLAGLKPWGDRMIHVSRGVGNIMGIRFGCRPEVAVLDLVPSHV
jgi:predicted MPP superfamily phosphohydrolase